MTNTMPLVSTRMYTKHRDPPPPLYIGFPSGYARCGTTFCSELIRGLPIFNRSIRSQSSQGQSTGIDADGAVVNPSRTDGTVVLLAGSSLSAAAGCEQCYTSAEETLPVRSLISAGSETLHGD